MRRGLLGERLRQQLVTCVPDPADEVAADADVERLVAGLSASEREVVELAAWEGLEPREIAEVLAISPAAARQRLSRARRTLREVAGRSPSLRSVPQEFR